MMTSTNTDITLHNIKHAQTLLQVPCVLHLNFALYVNYMKCDECCDGIPVFIFPL